MALHPFLLKCGESWLQQESFSVHEKNCASMVFLSALGAFLVANEHALRLSLITRVIGGAKN